MRSAALSDSILQSVFLTIQWNAIKMATFQKQMAQGCAGESSLADALALLFWNDRRRGARLSRARPTARKASAFQSDKLYVMILKVLAGLALLVVGSHFFVEEAVVLARRFGVSDAFISITVLAVGTSLPELAASIASAVKKNTQMALGNIIGSNIFNISFILGLCSQVSPLRSAGITPFDYGTMILAALMPVLFFLLGKRISRIGGLLMLVMYVLYLLKIAG